MPSTTLLFGHNLIHIDHFHCNQIFVNSNYATSAFDFYWIKNILLNSSFRAAVANLTPWCISPVCQLKQAIFWNDERTNRMWMNTYPHVLVRDSPVHISPWFKVNSSLWYGTNDLTERPSFPSSFPGAFTLSQTLCQTSITPQGQLTGPLKDAISVFCHEPQVFQVSGTLSLFSASATRDVWDFSISRYGQLCVFQGNGDWSNKDVTGIQTDDVLTCFSAPQGFDSIFDRFVLLIRISWCYWYTADRLYVILMEEKKQAGQTSCLWLSLYMSGWAVRACAPVVCLQSQPLTHGALWASFWPLMFLESCCFSPHNVPKGEKICYIMPNESNGLYHVPQCIINSLCLFHLKLLCTHWKADKYTHLLFLLHIGSRLL